MNKNYFIYILLTTFLLNATMIISSWNWLLICCCCDYETTEEAPRRSIAQERIQRQTQEEIITSQNSQCSSSANISATQNFASMQSSPSNYQTNNYQARALYLQGPAYDSSDGFSIPRATQQ